MQLKWLYDHCNIKAVTAIWDGCRLGWAYRGNGTELLSHDTPIYFLALSCRQKQSKVSTRQVRHVNQIFLEQFCSNLNAYKISTVALLELEAGNGAIKMENRNVKLMKWLTQRFTLVWVDRSRICAGGGWTELGQKGFFVWTTLQKQLG